MSARKVNGKFNMVSKIIRKYRKQNGWSENKLATKLNLLGLPFNKNAIQKIEANERSVRDFELTFFAEVFQIPIMEFFHYSAQDLDIT